MSDLETRLTQALRAESEDAPDGLGLAAAARTRARARRRTTVAVGAVAVAALAVPVAVIALGGSDDAKAPLADDSTAPDVEPADTGRWESWHGVTVQLPEDWEYGDQFAWCAGGGSAETFRISRPGGVSETIACTPGSSYGLTFQEIDEGEPFDWPVVTQTGDAWLPGTYVGAHGENGVLVTVAGPDREDLLDVLATIQPIGDGVDPHGCSSNVSGRPQPPRGGMSVCRYADGLLEESGWLYEDDTISAETALESAVVGDVDCEPGVEPPRIVLMRSARHEARLELDGGCQTFVLDGEPGHIVSVDVREFARLPGDFGQ